MQIVAVVSCQGFSSELFVWCYFCSTQLC